MNKLYCPQCEYQVHEEYPIKGEEAFCQNCLAWSLILVDDDSGDFYLEFLRYDSRETK